MSSSLKHRMTLIEVLELVHGKRKVHRRRIRRIEKSKTKSRNALVSTKKTREKFETLMPNSAKEALLLEKINGDFRWCNAIKKEIMDLEK